METIGNVFIVAIIFSAVYAVVKLLVRRKERLTMIEKGTSLPEIQGEDFSFSSIQYGVFFIGIGLGILAGNILAVTTRLEHEVAYFSMIFLFGGLALVIHYFMESKSKPG
jgi:hypothetical protein